MCKPFAGLFTAGRPVCKAFAGGRTGGGGRILGGAARVGGIGPCFLSFFSPLMPHLSTPAFLLKYTRRGALLLALGAAGPAAWGQSFGPVSFYSAGANSLPNALALADVNGDGRLDVITANSVSNTVGVLAGLPGGSLGPVTLYAVGAGSVPNAVVLADVNEDGRLDIVTANYGTNSVGVLLGVAGGSFGPVATYGVGVGSGPYGVAVGDVNNDGHPDIVSANYGSHTIGVLLGLSGGSFATASTYSTGTNSFPSSVVIADFDRDGRPDLATASTGATAVGILRGLAGGGFQAVANRLLSTTISPTDIAVADINGDGWPDLVTSNNGPNGLGSVGLLVSSGTGSFFDRTYPTGTAEPLGVAVGDLTGDGRLDYVTANTYTTLPASNVTVFAPGAVGSTPTSTRYGTTTLSSATDVALGDLNGDGRLDIVMSLAPAIINTFGGVGVLLNTGTYTPLATARPATADCALAPNPAHDGFTVQLPAAFHPTQGELLNSLGQVVRRPAVGSTSSFRVETSGLAPGLYTLRLQAGGALMSRRVAVE